MKRLYKIGMDAFDRRYIEMHSDAFRTVSVQGGRGGMGMKNRTMHKVLAGMLAAAMVLGTAACGDEENPSGSGQGGSSRVAGEGSGESGSGTSGTGETPSSGGTESTEGEPSEENRRPEIDMSPLSITVSLTSDKDHSDDNVAYDRLVKEINEYTQMDVTWHWTPSADYYNQLDLDIVSGNLSDVVIVKDNATFVKAAEEGVFWDLTDYIDDYDNLSTIPMTIRQNASHNGRMYGLPRSRTLARHGFGYRLDWLNKLGLKEPTDWQSFSDMLYAFTYNDPDKNGSDDTVGLYLDGWAGAWDIMMTWFGVPNVWGIDANGDLIHRSQTEEYKTALKAFRELYSMGVINDGSKGITAFVDVTEGKAVDEGLKTSKGGCGVQVLDGLRKVQTYFENEGLTTEDEMMFTLAGYVDTGKGPLCYPTTGMNNMLAVTKRNIKTEEQLRRVLQFLNDLNDGVCMNLLEYGWENETYSINEEGYVIDFDADTKAANGIPAGHNSGFQNVLTYFTAEEIARPATRPPYTSPIRLLEEQLYNDDIPYCVHNKGAGYVSQTYTDKGKDLDAVLTDAQLKYITGEIDDGGLDQALKSWWAAGGEAVTREMNQLYHGAGN